jgi:acetylornithine/succinyldiaminopimelate/putrescine aminotransferase
MSILTEVLRGGFEDFREFVNEGIALRALVAGEPVRVVRAEGGSLVTDEGQLVEDLHGTQAFGHRRPEIAQALQEYLDSDAPSWFPSRVNPFAGRLARRLCERTGYSNVFFASSGSEAVEAALKLARCVTRRPGLLSLDNAYHGCTYGSCSLMPPGVFRDPFAPLLPGATSLPWGDIDALHAALRAGDVAAVVVEPVQLEGGVRALSPAYIEALCELTERHGTLLVADEVQTGMGRTGQFLASASWPRRPDAVLLGKSLGGGLQALSCMLTRRELHERAYGSDYERAEAHNSTFSGHALACVAGLAALQLLTDDLLATVRSSGEHLRQQLRQALEPLPLFDEVRGVGLIAGLVVKPSDHPWLSFDHFGLGELSGKPTTGLLLCHRLYRRGWFCFVCGHDWRVLRLQPRFDLPRERLDALVSAVHQELEGLCRLT